MRRLHLSRGMFHVEPHHCTHPFWSLAAERLHPVEVPAGTELCGRLTDDHDATWPNQLHRKRQGDPWVAEPTSHDRVVRPLMHGVCAELGNLSGQCLHPGFPPQGSNGSLEGIDSLYSAVCQRDTHMRQIQSDDEARYACACPDIDHRGDRGGESVNKTSGMGNHLGYRSTA